MTKEALLEVNDTARQETSPGIGQPRTPQRLKYEAEVAVFLKRYGSLENVRKNLGFSQRKICQLLLVDPSAWSRWHAPGGRTPPHIYRALEWYLALEGRADLHPHLSSLYLNAARESRAEDGISKAEVGEMCRQIERLRRLVWLGPLIAAAAVGVTLWVR